MNGHASSFVVEAVVILGAAVVAPPLFNRLGLGAVVGYLLAGVLVGPDVIGLFQDPESILSVAELGVVLLLFLIGLELQLSRLIAMRDDILKVGLGQILVTTALFAVAGTVFGLSIGPALAVAVAFALSSTAVAARTLTERGDLSRPYGQRTFSVLLAQDIATVPVIALIAAAGGGGEEGTDPLSVALAVGGAVAAIATIVLAGRFLIDRFFHLLARWSSQEVMTAAALLVVLGAALIAEEAGLSMALGAFLAGLLLSESSYRHELEADVEPFRGLLLALFFMSVGMSIDLAAVGASVLPVTLGVVGALIAKFIVVYAIVRALGSPQRDGLRVAALLAPASEFAFVLLPAAFGSGLIDATLTAQLTAVAALSMLVGMPLLALVDRVIDRLPRRSKAEDMEESFDGARGTALVVGFGRFGQIAAQLLLAEGVETILIDANAERIRGAARFGFKVYYGDGKRIDVLRAAGAAKARLIMLCLEDGEASLRVSRLIRHEFPMATLHVRAINREHALALMELGVDYQIRETFESALAFGRASLEALGVAPERAAEVEEDVRRRDIERLELQRWGKDPYAGTDLLGQPIIRPAPLIVPTRAAEALNPEAEAAVAESDGGR